MLGRKERLHYTITADSAPFEAGLRRADGAVDRFDRGMTTTATRLERSFGRISASVGTLATGLAALGTAAALRGLTGAGRQALAFADDLQTAADAIGVSTEALKTFQLAAEEVADVAPDKATSALERFSRRLGEALQGTGELAKESDRLGIALRDGVTGRARDVESVLRDYADAIAEAGSQQERLALVQAGFGREFQAAVNVFADGAAGLDRVNARFRELGRIFDDDVAEGAARASDNLQRLERSAADAFRVGLVEGFAESLQDTGQQTEDLARAMNTLGQGVGGAFTLAVDSINALGAAIKSLDKSLSPIGGLSGLQAVASGLPFIGPSIGLPSQSQAASGDLYDPFSPDAPGGSGLANRGPLRVQFPFDPGGGGGAGAAGGGGFRGGAATGRAPVPAIANIDVEPLRRLEALLGDIDDGNKRVVGGFSEMDRAAQDLGFSFTSAFENAVIGGNNLREVLGGLLQDIARLTLRQTITQPLAGALSAGIGNIAGNLFGGGFSASPAFGMDFGGPRVAFGDGGVAHNVPGVSAASGSIINKPTFFPSTSMSRLLAFGGGCAVAGEAGPETILTEAGG